MRRAGYSFLVVVLVLLGVFAMFDPAKAARAVKFFESMKHTKGKFADQNFILLPWQRSLIEEVYGTVKDDGTRQYQTVYLEVAKKNGKSEMAAAAALYHLFADGEKSGEIYGCAGTREQASIVFNVAKEMLEKNATLMKRAKIIDSQKIIRDKKSGSFYKVVSAEAYTKHGLNISACIFDELHAQPSRELWDVMTFGAGDARTQPIWWVITTAGDDPDRVTVGWEQHEYAQAILKGEIVDPTWYVRIYGYEGEDVYNEDNWAVANPSLGTTIQVETVRAAAEKAKLKPADLRLFRWLRLNQWITTKLTAWLPLELFDNTVGAWSRDEQLGKDCYLGMDLSSTTDLTSLAVLFPPQGQQLDWRVFWHCWLPRAGIEERVRNDKIPYQLWADQGYLTLTEGDVIDYTVLETTILEIKKFYRVQEVCSDRAMAAMLVQRLEKAGLVCVDIPQTYQGLTDAMNQVEVFLRKQAGEDVHHEEREEHEGEDAEDAIPLAPKVDLLVGKMTHEHNPLVRWAFGNTSIAKNGQGYIKFVKQTKGKSVDRTKRIDPVAAWVDAMARARFYTGTVDISAAILDEDWGM